MKRMVLLALILLAFSVIPAQAQLTFINDVISDSVSTDTTGVDTINYSGNPLRTVDILADGADIWFWINDYSVVANTGRAIPNGGTPNHQRLIKNGASLSLATQRYNIKRIIVRKASGSGSATVWVTGGR